MKEIVCTFIGIFMAAGCSGGSKYLEIQDATDTSQRIVSPYSVQRHIDKKYGIVCYTYYSGGISCLEISKAPEGGL